MVTMVNSPIAPNPSRCRLCGQRGLILLLDMGDHPIAHRFLPDPSEDEYLHNVTLQFCQRCGLIQLTDPVPAEMLYSQYNWLSSWKWNPHVDRVVQLIDEIPGLQKTSRVVEVACNDGAFLRLLAQNGYQNLLGIEPANDAREAAQQSGLDTIHGYFSQETAEGVEADTGKCDLLIARHVLEHVEGLDEFASAMQVLLSPGAHVLFEVPNAEFNLRMLDYSAIWEEHVNYFTLGTIRYFFEHMGVEVLHSETATFSGEALIVVGRYHGRPADKPDLGHLSELSSMAMKYKNQWPEFRSRLRGYLGDIREKGGRVALYGAGCRASGLVNFTGIGPYLEFVADDQPEKQGKYMPGSRLPIVPSEYLEDSQVDLCLLAVNAENEKKVIGKHQAYLEKGGRFASVLPPSSNLLPIWDQRFQGHVGLPNE